MTSSQPPKLALVLLKLVGPHSDAVAGDLIEQFRAGKSATWFWLQVLGSLLMSCQKQLHTDRLAIVRAVAIGWAAMLVFFFFAGDVLTHSADQTLPRLLAMLGANDLGTVWLTRFRYIPPAVIGCVLSGWVVGRPVVFYAASVFMALLVGVISLAWIAAPVAVPHTLFYVIILALPYWWWSGLLIVPLLIVMGGLWRVASAHPLRSEVNGKLA